MVEDSSDNQALVQAYRKGFRIQLELASDGQEACEKIRLRAYDLIFMDMQMPVMDGYTATGEMRRLEMNWGRPKTPIVALTAHALNEEIRKSLDAGCDGYLAKPVRKQQLIEKIGHFAKGFTKASQGGSELRGKPSPIGTSIAGLVHAGFPQGPDIGGI